MAEVIDEYTSMQTVCFRFDRVSKVSLLPAMLIKQIHYPFRWDEQEPTISDSKS